MKLTRAEIKESLCSSEQCGECLIPHQLLGELGCVEAKLAKAVDTLKYCAYVNIDKRDLKNGSEYARACLKELESGDEIKEDGK